MNWITIPGKGRKPFLVCGSENPGCEELIGCLLSRKPLYPGPLIQPRREHMPDRIRHQF